LRTYLALVKQSSIVNRRDVQDSFLGLLDIGSSPAVVEALVNKVKRVNHHATEMYSAFSEEECDIIVALSEIRVYRNNSWSDC
jgi:hypothetical protein